MKPRIPVGREIFLFPTVPVGPSLAYAGSSAEGLAAEEGLEAGFPVPLESNRSDASVSLVGSMREASRHKLNIRLQVQGAAAYQQGLQALVDRALRSTDVRVSDIVRQVGRGMRIRKQTGSAVPRFSVQYGGRDAPGTNPPVSGFGEAQLGVEVDFQKTAIAALSAPGSHIIANRTTSVPGGTLPPEVLGSAQVVDRRGRVTVFFLVWQISTGKTTIVAYRYDQGSDTTWQSLVGIGDLHALDGSAYIWPSALNAPSIAATIYRDDTYVFVADAGVEASQGACVHVYRLSEQDTALWYVAGPVNIGTGIGISGRGGITACTLSDRVLLAVGCYSAAGALFPGTVRTIWIGQSSDMTTWSDQTDQAAGFIVLDDFRRALPPTTDSIDDEQVVNDIAFAQDGTTAWAVCQSGKIYISHDAGKTWKAQTSPVTTPLYAVATGAANQVVAVGAAGAVLRTLDGGETWLILSISSSEAANIDRKELYVSHQDKWHSFLGDQPLYDVYLRDDGTAWVVGENIIWSFHNLTYVVTAGGIKDPAEGTVVYNIAPLETQATYTTVTVSTPDPSQPTIVVGGIIKRQRNVSGTKDLKEYQFVKITGAIGPISVEIPSRFEFQNPTSDDNPGVRIERLYVRSALEWYACGKSGTLLKTIDGGTNWTRVLNSTPGGAPTSRDIMDMIFRPDGTSEAKNELLLITSDGLLMRSIDSGQHWATQHIGTEMIGVCLAVPYEFPLNVLATNIRSVILAGGGKSLWYTNLSAESLTAPALYPISANEAVLATTNMTRGRIDLHRTGDRGHTWEPINTDSAAQLNFLPQSTGGQPVIDDIWDPTGHPGFLTPTPSIGMTLAGELVVTAGTASILSQDGRGDEWVVGTSSVLALPIGPHPAGGATTFFRSRRILAFGGGRILSMVQTATHTIETWTSREWSDKSLTFMPVIPGVAQWIGVDDLRVIFEAAEIPVADGWDIPPLFRYPVSNLAVDMRAQYWRGPDDAVNPKAYTLQYQRTFSATTDVMGPGDHFEMTAAALIGTNFRECVLAISRPNTAETNVWTEFHLRADVDSQIITAVPGTDVGENILLCNGATWIPGHFKSTFRKYYALVGNVVYAITDNSKDALIVGRKVGDTAIAAGTQVVIFGDRFWCDGSGGYRGLVAAPPLINSPYVHGLMIQIRIPVQPTAEGYRKCDKAMLGVHVPPTVETAEGVIDRDPIAESWLWRSKIATVEEEAMEGGVTSVEVFGDVFQEWELPYGGQYDADLQALYQPLVARMRRPFVIVFDDANPLESMEYVRMTSEPEVVHVNGNVLQTKPLILQECK